MGRSEWQATRQDGCRQNSRRENTRLGSRGTWVSFIVFLTIFRPESDDRDGTMVSGDSLGIVKFWESRTSTQLQSFQGHGADVLCLAIGPVCFFPPPFFPPPFLLHPHTLVTDEVFRRVPQSSLQAWTRR